jgi:hypothetical protein
VIARDNSKAPLPAFVTEQDYFHAPVFTPDPA